MRCPICGEKVELVVISTTINELDEDETMWIPKGFPKVESYYQCTFCNKKVELV